MPRLLFLRAQSPRHSADEYAFLVGDETWLFPRKITARIDRGASFWGRTVEVSQFCPAETEPGSEGPIQETWALSKARLHNRGRQHLVHREGRITVRLEHCEETGDRSWALQGDTPPPEALLQEAWQWWGCSNEGSHCSPNSPMGLMTFLEEQWEYHTCRSPGKGSHPCWD